MKTLLRKGLGTAFLLAAQWVFGQQIGTPSSAALDTPILFSIPAQPLADALAQFAQQTGLQLIVPTGLVKGLKAPPIFGSLRPAQCLRRLLEPSGLAYQLINDRTVAIEQSKKTSGVPPPSRERPQVLAQTSLLTPADQAATSADAPSGEAPRERTGALEEVTVTSQRREQSGQDVGIALTALSGAQLAQLGIRSSTDLSQQIPALQFNNALGGNALAIPSIRGVSQNDFTIHHEGPVASYVDDVYLSFAGAASFELFDINRVEVLRGPQGTLFGRNATGGLIHYVSNRPTDHFEAYSDITIGRFDQIRHEGAISGPLTESVTGRLAATAEYYEPYMKNLYGPGGVGEKTAAVRGRIDARIGDNVDLLVTLNYGKEFPSPSNRYKHATVYPDADGNGVILPSDTNYYGTCPGCDENGWRDPPTDAWTGTWDYNAHTERQLFGLTSDLEWRVGEWHWVWLNSYQNFRMAYSEDSDATPFPVIVYHADQSAYQISEEVRASRDFTGAHWVSGIYLLDIDGDTATPTNLPEFAIDLLPSWNQKTRSYALFAQADWQLADQWTLSTGARWTHDQKLFDYFSGGSGGTGLVFNTRTVGNLADQRKDLFSGKLQLEWRPVSRTLLFAGVSRGVKGGGFNGSLDGTTTVKNFPYQPEALTSYEMGFKVTLSDEHLRLNGSVFDYDYHNYQGFKLQGLNVYVGNYDATAYGGELEVVGKIPGGWDYSIGLSALHFSVHDVVLPSGRLADTHPPQAAPFEANLVMRKTWGLHSGAQIVAQGDAQRVGHYFASLTNAPDTSIPAYWLSNARASYEAAGGGWDVGVFCKNLTNKQILAYSVDTVSLAYVNLYYLPPRWYGVEVVKHW